MPVFSWPPCRSGSWSRRNEADSETRPADAIPSTVSERCDRECRYMEVCIAVRSCTEIGIVTRKALPALRRNRRYMMAHTGRNCQGKVVPEQETVFLRECGRPHPSMCRIFPPRRRYRRTRSACRDRLQGPKVAVRSETQLSMRAHRILTRS